MSEAIELINDTQISVPDPSVWADLGCGSGLFTHALAQLLLAGSTIYAFDKDLSSWNKNLQKENVTVKITAADFVKDDLRLHHLDGIMMANSLHFVNDKISLLNKLRQYMKAHSLFLIVEYDMDTANPWVPFPVSYHSLKQLFEKLPGGSLHKIHERPSVYNRANIYSALISF
ncbi:MAG TPA: class I SAM-dependent methyltransferase [Chitinophagales bacterium]|nr:class I SAM-dependent methyltransferase [Chitinophagales bacterium]